ncbi:MULTISPECIES: ATP-binding cassette domain-containing protein [Moraxella]|uniref:ABC transporter domain-containing protein n=1 Tax=Moraxella lacunata TaxID=477 RepID=A0A1B8Q3N9_MORLA|nr:MULTISPECIES: ATP-binding cassette domain-containing protein [Moraxella]MBE9578469.1 ATP-binding cassette domain-containing protein [Moraxella sp. K1664]MBE9587506.1 ATP-binding cassette domain-containing protein [Moraxella sp. K1630]MBE9590159.1 ATP-binding cassette domain-containing protein [Moraxella sp. K127]MBE9595998.1 ATP-binding cassette domain-containing protein [Moraxella sp. K2450]MDH9217873.1 ATP-binding cassette domain-containing protein [Moraxella lacunata]
MSLLTATALSYHTPDRTLLDNVSFALHYGQKVALVGRSGSGKSILLQALADLLPLDNAVTDRIMLNKNGKLTPLSQISPPDYRTAVALFHQTPSLSDGTVLDNLTAPFGFKHHQNKKFDKDWHLQQLTTLGKHDNFINQSIHELSGGERQIVSFLRTLQFNPTLALFDETTSALDDETANLLMRLVLDWHDNHKALIWVTHTPSEQQVLGADLWRMDNGMLAV